MSGSFTDAFRLFGRRMVVMELFNFHGTISRNTFRPGNVNINSQDSYKEQLHTAGHEMAHLFGIPEELCDEVGERLVLCDGWR